MMVCKMTAKVAFEMFVHIATENIIFELFKEIIEIKVEIAGTGSFLVSKSSTAMVILLTLLWI